MVLIMLKHCLHGFTSQAFRFTKFLVASQNKKAPAFTGALWFYTDPNHPLILSPHLWLPHLLYKDLDLGTSVLLFA